METQIGSCPIQLSAALKNPSLTLSSLLKSSQNIGFSLWQKWGQLPAPLIILIAFCNPAVERLKGKYEGLLKYICTPSRCEGQSCSWLNNRGHQVKVILTWGFKLFLTYCTKAFHTTSCETLFKCPGGYRCIIRKNICFIYIVIHHNVLSVMGRSTKW